MFKSFLLASASALALISAPVSASTVFTDSTPGSTTFTAAASGQYRIKAFGASGGIYHSFLGASYSGGYGVGISGDFTLTRGEVIDIGVGLAGARIGDFGYGSGSGGGASFAVHAGAPLIIAGGGGGGDADERYSDHYRQNATASQGSAAGLGGAGGYPAHGANFGGPGAGAYGAGGGGGGGFNSDGQAGISSYGYFDSGNGYTYGRNATGGAGGKGFTVMGGGQPGSNNGGGGGGGGFNGGAGGGFGNEAGAYTGPYIGSGGTSFNTGANQAVLGFHAGDGFVEIDAVPEPAGWVLMLTGFGAIGATIRRKRALRRA